MTTNNLMMLRRGGKNVTKTVMAKKNKFVQQIEQKNILFGNSEKTVVRVIVAHIIHALK